MDVTYVPNPNAADGHLGTGSNLNPIPEYYSNVLITYVPNPNAADGRGVSVGGGDNIKTWDGDPNGNVTMTGPGLVLGEGSTAGEMWFKITAGTGSGPWFKVLH
jgi:hypothetical protein